MNYIQHEQVKGRYEAFVLREFDDVDLSGIGFWRKIFMREFWKSCRNCLDNTAT